MVWRYACGLDIILALIIPPVYEVYRGYIVFSSPVRSTGELLQSPRSSASAFPSHCDKVLYASFSKVHISTATHQKAFERLFDVWTSYYRIMSRYDPTFDLKLNVGHCDLYFMVQWFCLTSRRLFAASTSYFRIMSQYDTTFDLKVNVGHCDLYFMIQWFCLISWRLFDIWILYSGIMSQYDLKFDLKINVSHCDLYFMVQWFCLISWKLFSSWTSYFGTVSQYDPTSDL